MVRTLAVVAEDGVDACTRGDRVRATMLVVELIAAVDLEHMAARSVCRMYDEALAGLAAGHFTPARTLFQALREV